jgi:hypothetical protein
MHVGLIPETLKIKTNYSVCPGVGQSIGVNNHGLYYSWLDRYTTSNEGERKDSHIAQPGYPLFPTSENLIAANAAYSKATSVGIAYI